MLKCFLCEKTGVSVKKFNKARLDKCRKIQAFRKKKKLIQLDVVLPKNLQQKGFHLQCYDKFIMLKGKNKKEFDSMVSNNKVLIKNIPPLKINPSNAFKKNAASTSNGRAIPKLVAIPDMGTKTYDIELKVTPKTYQMDEPSYVNPDIARGVILKSILTRKSPIKKDMMNNSQAFNSGMDLLRYGSVFNQPNWNFNEDKSQPKTYSLNDCLFCGKEKRKIGMQVELPQLTSDEEYEKVLEAAKAMEDKLILRILLIGNNIRRVHSLCRAEYKNRHQKITTRNCDEQDRLVIEDLQTKVLEALYVFIDEKIIDQNKTYFLTDVFERYKAIVSDIQNTTSLDIDSFNVQKLQEEILNNYEGSIKITTMAKKKVVHKNGTTDLDSASAGNENLKYDKIAFELHSEIKSLKRKSFGKNEEIPEKLLRFVGTLIKGPYAGDTFEDIVTAKAFCEQIVTQINMD